MELFTHTCPPPHTRARARTYLPTSIHTLTPEAHLSPRMSWCHIRGITQQVLVTVMDELRQLRRISPRLSALPVWGLWRGSAHARARHLSLCLGCWHEADRCTSFEGGGGLPTLVSQENYNIEEIWHLLGQNPGNKIFSEAVII